MANDETDIKTVRMQAKDFLADPRSASRQAEAHGRVVVVDERGAARLVINSNRVTSTFVDE